MCKWVDIIFFSFTSTKKYIYIKVSFVDPAIIINKNNILFKKKEKKNYLEKEKRSDGIRTYISTHSEHSQSDNPIHSATWSLTTRGGKMRVWFLVCSRRHLWKDTIENSEQVIGKGGPKNTFKHRIYKRDSKKLVPDNIHIRERPKLTLQTAGKQSLAPSENNRNRALELMKMVLRIWSGPLK